MAAGIAYITAGKRMATDLRVVKLPAVQGRFARRYQSASDDGKGCEGGMKVVSSIAIFFVVKCQAKRITCENLSQRGAKKCGGRSGYAQCQLTADWLGCGL
jgi:hypothetical protein